MESAVTYVMFLSSISTFKLSTRKTLAHADRTDLVRPDVLRAKAVALRTRAIRAVEREQARLDLRERESVVRAGELCAKAKLSLSVMMRHDIVAVFERRFDRLRQAQAIVFVLEVHARRNAVHDEIDVVRFVTAKAPRGRGANDICRRCALRKIPRSKNHRASGNTPLSARARPAQIRIFRPRCLLSLPLLLAVLRNIDRNIHDLLVRQLFDLAAAVRTKRLSRARKKHAEIIVDLRDRRDRRTRVRRMAFLVDGNRRRKSFDLIHVRLVEPAQKLPRVRGKRFDVAALAFGERSYRTPSSIFPNPKAP